MAAITTTPAQVRPLGDCETRRFTTGGTVTPGQAVYVDSSGLVQASDADAAASARPIGIALSDSFGSTSFPTGSVIDVALEGPVTGYASMTPGALVYNSGTAGAIDQTAPATSGQYPAVVGWAESAATLYVNPGTVLPIVVA